MIYSVAMPTEYLTLEMDAPEERSDEELLRASIAHPSLFALIVRKYEAPFLRKAGSIVKSREEAEDVVQEAFTKIYLHAATFKKQDGASFSSWAWKIVINTALSHYAKNRRHQDKRADIEPEILELIPDKNLRQFEAKEFADEVASVLARMPAPFARVLDAFFLRGLSQEEIAREEGMTVGAIKTRVHRAKREFRRIYALFDSRGA